MGVRITVTSQPGIRPSSSNALLKRLGPAGTRDDAARQLYAATAEGVRRRLMAWSKGRLGSQEIKELADTAYAKLWVWVSDGNDPSAVANVEYFLVATAQRLWLDVQRKYKRWQPVEIGSLAETLADISIDPELTIIQRERYERRAAALRQAISVLEPKQPRPVLILRLHLDGWSNARISQELGLKPESVRTSLSRTRAALVRLMTSVP